jgi:hypothetical protein
MGIGGLFQRIGNTFVGGILHSPFHRLLSKNTMLITFTGRVSGKRYTTPVNYLLIGDVLYVLSVRDRTWWRNLRGGGPVTLRLSGEKAHGWGDVVEDDEGIHQHLLTYLQEAPNLARYFGVGLDVNGQPDGEDVARASRSRVMVMIRLNE